MELQDTEKAPKRRNSARDEQETGLSALSDQSVMDASQTNGKSFQRGCWEGPHIADVSGHTVSLRGRGMGTVWWLRRAK